MDLNRIIQELHRERERVRAMIESLERMDPASPSTYGMRSGRLHKRRGRKAMGGAERQEVSRRMKLYWEQRKQQPSANIKDIRPPVGMEVGD
jgi:hypothetical protein